MHTLKKFSAARSAAKLLHIFSRRASRGAAWPLHVKFASYAYDTELLHDRELASEITVAFDLPLPLCLP